MYHYQFAQFAKTATCETKVTGKPFVGYCTVVFLNKLVLKQRRARSMRAMVLIGLSDACEVGPRSAAELREAATHFNRAAVLCDAPAVKAYSPGGDRPSGPTGT